MVSEFYFENKYIKGKEKRVTYDLRRLIQLNDIVVMSYYGTDQHGRILQACQQDFRYMKIVHRLQ